ncbi:MAG: DUF2147 domain-containing protein [Microscillaceae bacterium]|jgi:uncharacterized protein (DUF2147 family)|nr:DUF2147 domain-containing protein [Microscillaceae bacterium]
MKFINKFGLLLTLSLFLGFSKTSAQDAADIVGVWMPSEGTSYIRIFKEKGKEKYHGKVVWLKTPNDEQGNPRKDPKGTPIMNMLNLKNFEFKDGKWTNGTIYDPKSGNTYYCTIEMVNKDKIEVRGSIDSFGLVGRTDTWVRMKNTPSN